MTSLPLIFMGSPSVAVTILENLLKAGYDIRAVVTQPDKVAGRGQKLQAPPVKLFAEKNNLKVLQPLKVKDPAFVEELKSFGAKALIVAAYGRILSQEILDLTPYPLNVHFSLLPKYRGASCVASAILNGESETGVTLMKIVEELDAGPILKQVSMPITDQDTTGILEEKLAVKGGELLVECLKDIENGNFTLQDQDPLQAIYAPLINKEDALIDWNRSTQHIFNQIRAYQPWPIAYSYIDKKRFKIYAAVANNNPHTEIPGTILHLSDEGMLVSCGEGSLLIKEVQLEGKNRMSAGDFLKGSGRNLKVGQKI